MLSFFEKGGEVLKLRHSRCRLFSKRCFPRTPAANLTQGGKCLANRIDVVSNCTSVLEKTQANLAQKLLILLEMVHVNQGQRPLVLNPDFYVRVQGGHELDQSGRSL